MCEVVLEILAELDTRGTQEQLTQHRNGGRGVVVQEVKQEDMVEYCYLQDGDRIEAALEEAWLGFLIGVQSENMDNSCNYYSAYVYAKQTVYK